MRSHHFVAARLGERGGGHRRAPGRQLVDDRHIEVRVRSHRERARYGRRRHDQLMRLPPAARAFFAQAHALMHAEAVLLIDDREAERGELHALLKERMRADDERRAALAQRRPNTLARLAGLPARGERDVDPERLEPAAKIVGVLVGQEFRRRHERDLVTGLDGARRGERRHQRLAAADIALHEPQHRLRELKIRSRSRRARAPVRASAETAATRGAAP